MKGYECISFVQFENFKDRCENCKHWVRERDTGYGLCRLHSRLFAIGTQDISTCPCFEEKLQEEKMDKKIVLELTEEEARILKKKINKRHYLPENERDKKVLDSIICEIIEKEEELKPKIHCKHCGKAIKTDEKHYVIDNGTTKVCMTCKEELLMRQKKALKTIEWLTDNQILAIVRSVQSRNAGPFDELLYGLSHEQIFYTLEYLVSDWKCNNHD